MKPLASAALALLVVSCSSSNDAADVPERVRDRVTVFVQDGNCQGLQAEFDNAADAEVMKYVDGKMQDAGCY